MKRKKYKQYSLAITIVIGIIIGWSAINGELTIALCAIVIGMIILYLIKSRVKQIIEDERIYRISEKASRRTIQIVGTTTALIGLSLVGLSRSGYFELSDVGFSLAYFATALLMVYMIFYGYYSKKLGE